jgi:hypothetical protein
MSTTSTIEVFDVTKDSKEPEEIKWCSPSGYNLIKYSPGIGIGNEGLTDMFEHSTPFVTSTEEAENLIKALRKAIDLGWVK